MAYIIYLFIVKIKPTSLNLLIPSKSSSQTFCYNISTDILRQNTVIYYIRASYVTFGKSPIKSDSGCLSLLFVFLNGYDALTDLISEIYRKSFVRK